MAEAEIADCQKPAAKMERKKKSLYVWCIAQSIILYMEQSFFNHFPHFDEILFILCGLVTYNIFILQVVSMQNVEQSRVDKSTPYALFFFPPH